MHPKVLRADGWTIVRGLVRAGLLRGWALAGGTGLALQLGHRVSEDLDFFRVGPFEVEELAAALARVRPVHVQARSAGTLHVTLAGLRVSFLSAQAPLLFPGTAYRGIVVADPRDIAVMKVIAIGGRGSRKDFVDLFFYLGSGGSLEAVFEMIRRRFVGIDFNEYHLLRSLAFFEDAETEPMPRMLRRVTWASVKKTIVVEVRRLS
ncbi:MAG: nucleotidyl transferase AbiEii/AbiGii toxin family protein [Acidobacteriia bacterium]|nr:nucleotidyl transferase AbiEii/AbiGii toxin family protein [Terriglobia bacterium]